MDAMATALRMHAPGSPLAIGAIAGSRRSPVPGARHAAARNAAGLSSTRDAISFSATVRSSSTVSSSMGRCALSVSAFQEIEQLEQLEQLEQTYEEEWRKYQSKSRNKNQQAFERNDGIIYLRDFLPKEDFDSLLAHCRKLRKGLKKEKDTIALNRKGTYVKQSSPVHELVMNEDIARRLGQVVGEEIMTSDYPVELREYQTKAAMDWHRDTQLFARPQYELVLTLSNESDSFTEWKCPRGGEVTSQWTEPNSLIVVRAGGALHRVTSLTKGRRSILKLCYTPTLERHDNFGTYSGKQY